MRLILRRFYSRCRNSTSAGNISAGRTVYRGGAGRIRDGRGENGRKGPMRRQKEELILHNHNNDGVDRRGFLKCMAWAGTGAVCLIEGGVLKSFALGSHGGPKIKTHKAGGLTFVQISDSHMGFNKPANPDVVGTLKAAVDKINALPQQ